MLINLYIDEQDDNDFTHGTIEVNVIPSIGDKLYLSVAAVNYFNETFRGNTKLSMENRAVEITDKYIFAHSPILHIDDQEMEVFAKLLDSEDESKFINIKASSDF